MIRPVSPLAVRAVPTLDLPPAVMVGALEAIRSTGSGQVPGTWLDANRYLVAEYLEGCGYRIAWAEGGAGFGFEVVTECGLYLVANGRAGRVTGRLQRRLEDHQGGRLAA